jgi:hypothetical protein
MKRLSDQSNNVPGRKYQADYTSGTTQEWIMIDDSERGEAISVGLDVSTGTGSIEYTMDSEESVIADAATGIPWPAGTITVPTMDYFPSAVTAVRAVRATNTVRLIISR